MNSIKGSFVLGKRLSCATFSKNFSAGDRCVNLLPAVSSCMLKNDFRTSSHSRSLVGEKLSSNQKPDWNRAVSEAEKIVGYPTSFLSLRWLLSDEIANVALHLRKLVGSNHPLLKTAKSLLYSGRNNMQAWGLIVLLISKAAGHLKVDEMEEDKAAGVLHSQRALAEVTEMIRTSHLVHKGLVNIYPGLYPDSIVLGDMMFGNKIALLGGDYLLGNCCAELAALRNQNLIEIMSSAIRDLTEGEFIGPRDMQNNPLPSRFPSLSSPISPHQLALSAAVKDWRQRNILSAASLLGNSCKGTLILAGHDAALQEHAYEFGKHLALASQMAKRPFREYSKRDMKNALLELKKNGSKLLSVSKKYKIPRSTLRRLRKKELLSPEKMGPPTLLTTQEEDILVAWLLELKDRGFPVNREQLIATVKNLLDKSERKVEKFVDNRPGQKWVDLFEKRHPEITLRTPQQLVKRRSDITKEDIENWFDETKDYLQKNNWFDVLSDPSRIFNCDEAAFLMNPKGNRVYAGKGDKTVYHVSGDDKECITVLFMISAADIQLPPMLVFKYERIPYDLTLKIPAHWAVGRSPETGWMTCCTFYEYISNVFYPWLIQNKVTLPVILFLDGHVSHMSPLLSEFCSDRGIILFAFVPNATHIQQPCDVSLFRPLKSIWKEEVRKWKDENEEFSLSKKDCAPILQKAFDRIEFSVIRNGFRTCGLYPFDKKAIDYKKLLKKNSEATSNTSEIVAETPSSFKKHLQFIEKRISPRKLQLYKCGEAGGDDSLYQFWQKLHDDATGSSFTSNSSTFLESSTNSFENSTSSDNLQLPSPSEIAAPLNLPFTESVVMSTPSADISGLSTSNSAPVVTSTPLADISGLNASNSTSVAVSTPLADIPGPSNSNNAPKNIPSPFKNLLPWPIVMKKKNGSKSTRNKEKLPYAVTSAEWQSYHKKKELEKEKLEKEKADRKDMRLQKKKEKEEKQKQSKGQKSKKKSKCTIVRSIESESEEDDPKWFSDPSDSESFSDEDINDTHHSHETKIEVGTYLLMKLKTEDNKEDVYYVAVVLAVNEKSLSVKYFRKTEKGSFKLPPIEDVGDVSYEKIEKILPAPIPGSTRRQKDIIKFNFDFATLNLR